VGEVEGEGRVGDTMCKLRLARRARFAENCKCFSEKREVITNQSELSNAALIQSRFFNNCVLP
jgi:hypothetical protein